MSDQQELKACTRCGESKPILTAFTNSKASRDGKAYECKACAHDRWVGRRLRLPELVRQQHKESVKRHYQANKEKIQADRKRRLRDDADKMRTYRDYHAKYRENNRERISTAVELWRKTDQGKRKRAAWEAANHELIAAFSRNRRARLRSNGGEHTAADVKVLMARQKGRCAHPWCPAFLKVGYDVDHIIPLKLGGTNDRKNLQLLCRPCNRRKSYKHPLDFSLRHGFLV